MDSFLDYSLLFLAGFFAGVINIIAGGGSFLTLPVLIFLGLPATAANGTNRVGILFQNIGAVWSFQRHRLINWDSLAWAALPASVGSLLGVWIALVIGDVAFQRILAFLMVALTLWSLWDPVSKRAGKPAGASRTRLILTVVGFFIVGVYGGFVQAGVGFLILAVTNASGLDLVRGNALKVLTILIFTILSLALFWWSGQVYWVPGVVLAVSNTLGGLLGVRLTIVKGHRWVKMMVTGAIVFFALKLWLLG